MRAQMKRSPFLVVQTPSRSHKSLIWTNAPRDCGLDRAWRTLMDLETRHEEQTSRFARGQGSIDHFEADVRRGQWAPPLPLGSRGHEASRHLVDLVDLVEEAHELVAERSRPGAAFL